MYNEETATRQSNELRIRNFTRLLLRRSGEHLVFNMYFPTRRALKTSYDNSATQLPHFSFVIRCGLRRTRALRRAPVAHVHAAAVG